MWWILWSAKWKFWLCPPWDFFFFYPLSFSFSSSSFIFFINTLIWDTELAWVLVHSPNMHSSQGLARLTPEVRNSVTVSAGSSRDLSTQALICSLAGGALAGSGAEGWGRRPRCASVPRGSLTAPPRPNLFVIWGQHREICRWFLITLLLLRCSWHSIILTT